MSILKISILKERKDIMREVVCWCCEYFYAKFEDPVFRELITKEMCTYKLQICEPEDKVCENFLLYRGLFTKRTIPERCKNYYQK